MERIFISACLLGEKVRYHGGDALTQHSVLEKWIKENRLVSFCPEVAAGFSVPRPPSEIIGQGGGQSVLNDQASVHKQDGKNYSSLFIKGAELALKLCQQHNIKLAILKNGSPSCGSAEIYDGSFSGNKIKGMGVTASLLYQHGIKVFSEQDIEKALVFFNQLNQ